MKVYLSEQCRLYKLGYQLNPDIKLLGIKPDKDFTFNVLNELNDEVLNQKEENFRNEESGSHYSGCLLTARKHTYFENVENAASEILYRCIDCRNCIKYKNGERIEMLSLKEEVKQYMIQKSVNVDVSAGKTIAKLPLLENPAIKLAPNKEKALAVYKSQLKKLNKSEKDKKDVLESEARLQRLGHVDFVI